MMIKCESHRYLLRFLRTPTIWQSVIITIIVNIKVKEVETLFFVENELYVVNINITITNYGH